ncbi:MAG: HEAT repeat domain-containing protein [Allosphingosinicella sp.]
MSKVDQYRAALRDLSSGQWEPYLQRNSHLPGPRGNLELAWAVAEEAVPSRIRRYAASDDEYLGTCGAIGLGRLLAEGDGDALVELHRLAADRRWRVREGVAMALQRLGDIDRKRMLVVAEMWSTDPSWLVKRAAVAGVCEPRLLDRPSTVQKVLGILDRVTKAVGAASPDERRLDDFRALRQALGYCWSVAIAALPAAGFDRFEGWSGSADPDVIWIIRENLKKKRLRKADPDRFGDLSRLF